MFTPVRYQHHEVRSRFMEPKGKTEQLPLKLDLIGLLCAASESLSSFDEVCGVRGQLLQHR